MRDLSALPRDFWPAADSSASSGGGGQKRWWRSVRKSLVLVVGLLSAGDASAQVERFELGQRLRAFEQAFQQHMGQAARKRALVPLLQATTLLLSFQVNEAGRALDQARQALVFSTGPPEACLWAESLYIRPATQALDASSPATTVSLRPFYKSTGELPNQARLRLVVENRGGQPLTKPVRADISSVPLQVQLPLQGVPPGDHVLRHEICAGGKTLASAEMTLSLVPRLQQRLQALEKGVAELGLKTTTDSATLRELVETLGYLASGQAPETNYPADRLCTEAEQLLQAIRKGEPFYGQKKTGEFWLRLATNRGQVVARLFAPQGVRQGQRLPLVIALHGTGGSENMFFDAYGRGEVVRQCRQRGWLLVTPRANQFFGFNTPAAAVIDAVDKLYPVDRQRVFLLGHSIGAAQALGAVQQHPDRFAAVAALGGSGTINGKSDLRQIPFFVGVGSNDFTVGGARKLESRLKELGVAKVEFQEYPDIEHITVVQRALPQVFAFFDRIKAKGQGD